MVGITQGGHVQRRRADIVSHIHGRSPRQQRGDHGRAAGIGEHLVQRRPAAPGFHIRIRPLRQQHGNRGRMAPVGGVVQWRVALRSAVRSVPSAWRVHIRPGRDQRGDDRHAAVSGGVVQRRLAVLVKALRELGFLMHIGPMGVEEVVDGIQVALKSGLVQGISGNYAFIATRLPRGKGGKAGRGVRNPLSPVRLGRRLGCQPRGGRAELRRISRP